MRWFRVNGTMFDQHVTERKTMQMGHFVARVVFVTVVAAAPWIVQAADKGKAAGPANAAQLRAWPLPRKIAGCNDCHTPGYLLSAGKIPEAQWLTGRQARVAGPVGYDVRGQPAHLHAESHRSAVAEDGKDAADASARCRGLRCRR